MSIFERSKKLELNRFDTLIAATTEITGKFSSKGTVKVAGKISGIVTTDQVESATKDKTVYTIIVEKGGLIDTSSLLADFVVVNGEVKGDIFAREHIIIGPTGVVQGNITYGSIEIAQGAHINGEFKPIKPRPKVVSITNGQAIVEDDHAKYAGAVPPFPPKTITIDHVPQ
jgi:cytoskeletal protein CcmA (bactofilin family)